MTPHRRRRPLSRLALPALFVLLAVSLAAQEPAKRLDVSRITQGQLLLDERNHTGACALPEGGPAPSEGPVAGPE